MRITYIANARIPTERANGIQIMHMCEAFAAAGAEVELVVPWRLNPLKEDPYRYYGVKKNFSIRRLPSLDLVQFGKIGFWIQEWTFLVSAVFFLMFSKKESTIYVRGERLARGILAAISKRPVFLESHMMPRNFNAYRAAFVRARGVVVITKHYEQELRDAGVNVLCVPDAVTISDFDIALSRDEARQYLRLPREKQLVLYTGHLYAWKGADVLARAASLLPQNVLVAFVGGSPEDVEPFRKRYGDDSHILITGQRPYTEIPAYLKAADVLVLPNTAREAISRWYTSPMKLFEYMASGRPIVAANLPSFRDVLNERNALLVSPDDPQALATGIKEFLDNPARAEPLAKQARADVEQYTWERRAQSVLGFMGASSTSV